VALRGDEGAAAEKYEQPDGDVDEEHPPPAQRVGEESAEDQPDDDADARHRPVER
jgi:hypothetical protein